MNTNHSPPLYLEEMANHSGTPHHVSMNIDMHRWLLSPVYEAFANASLHCIEARGEWNPIKLMADFSDYANRSIFDEAEYLDDKDKGWDKILFRFDAHFYVFFYYGSLCVYCMNPDKGRTWVSEHRKKYQKIVRTFPVFYLLKYDGSDIELQDVKIKNKAEHSDEMLALQYGADFPEWEDQFLEAFDEKEYGITIFQGKPGTGKTSYIRHLATKLRKTHRFYFIPPSNFRVLKDPEFVSFWSDQTLNNSKFKKVVVLEDAEGVLMPRASDNRDELSALLNMTDGMMGEFLKIHLICSINCQVESLDPAVLRPGRLVSRKIFTSLSPCQAKQLAEKLGKRLVDKDRYTLAEVYTEQDESVHLTTRKPMGFEA